MDKLTCQTCGNEIDETDLVNYRYGYGCDQCGDNVCKDCASYCSVCGKKLCQGCVDTFQFEDLVDNPPICAECFEEPEEE